MLDTVNGISPDFCLKIAFEKGQKDPNRVFKTLVGLIEAFTFFDSVLIGAIDTNIEPLLLLEDVETGSLKVWLRYALENLPDDALNNLEWKQVVGQYLVKGKYKMIDFLNKANKITKAADVDELQSSLLTLAQDTNAKWIPHYQKASKKGLLQSVQKITTALIPLNQGDTMSLITTDAELKFDISVAIAPDAMDDLLTTRSIKSQNTMILKVKRPDYLGLAQWEFRHGKQSISAKIIHTDWLLGFQKRQTDVRPGDSLIAKVNISLNYSSDNELVSTGYEVAEVIAIETEDTPEQLQL
jgi:hypothetical protein